MRGAGVISSNRGGQFNPKRHSFGVPSGTSLPSVQIVLSEPFGADCIPGGVSPWGLDAGAPPDLVLSGPVFPCGCVTFPLGLEFVDGSLGFDWEKATDPADKAKAAVKAMSPRDMATSEGLTPSPETGVSSNVRAAGWPKSATFRMSALGHKRTFAAHKPMSAKCQKRTHASAAKRIVTR